MTSVLHVIAGCLLVTPILISGVKRGESWKTLPERSSDEPFFEYDNCKIVVKIADKNENEVVECFPVFPNTSWYGDSGHQESPSWPLNFDKATDYDVPSITGGHDGQRNQILNRFWINSAGESIKVDDDVPLFTRVLKFSVPKEFCLVASHKFPYREEEYSILKLTYTKCIGYNLKDLFIDTVYRNFQKVNGAPLEQIFRTPIWSTSPALGNDILGSKTLVDFARNITYITNNDGSSNITTLLKIGPTWQSCLGEFRFRSTAFGNPQQLMGDLKQLNMDVALTILPFHGKKCLKNLRNEYFVLNQKSRPDLREWEQDTVALVDFTQDEAREWWVKRLYKDLMEKFPIVSTLFFDQGLASFLSQDYLNLNAPIPMQPGAYSAKYLEVASRFNAHRMVGMGYLSQQHPMLVQMPPVESNWQGLQSIIPQALQFGILGFPFFVPDVVGGSKPSSQPDKTLEANLYVRWLQLNAFMPIMHLSRGPWEFYPEIVEIAKDVAKLREDYMPLLTYAASKASEDGSPMIRPMWWLAPEDKLALACNDQFLIGDDLIVAPVVTDTAERDIYFPPGEWFDEEGAGANNAVGPDIKTYKVPLAKIKVFKRVGAHQ